MDPQANHVYEVSWEVCNKVGGINTVLKSKAARMVENYHDGYFAVGPYFQNKVVGEFSEQVPEANMKQAFETLKNEGIICHFGMWNIEGTPKAILVDCTEFKSRINDIKKELWETYKVDSLRTGSDYDDPVVWSYAVGKMLELLKEASPDKKVVAHFHEWLAGAGLLYLKRKKVQIGTVFTTHATTLGRTLASSGVDLYNEWDKIDPDKAMYDYHVEAKHSLERSACHCTDIFTTVSEITAMEAEHLLGRKADVLVLNGLDGEKFPTFEELAIKHQVQRSRIREFFLYYFFPYYTFDLSQSLTFFIAARNEFHDKGIDVFIKALGKLNERMQKEKHKKTIVAFFFVPNNPRNVKPELIENKTNYQDIEDFYEETDDDVNKNILNGLIAGAKLTEQSLFEKSFLMEMKKKIKRFKKEGCPPVATHDLYEEYDAILNAFKESGLENKKKDPVKVVYYPIYLSGADGLLNLGYYEAIQGSHLGVFPSYYEPWGYTPLEAGALGVASVTTDLAGFGRFFEDEDGHEKMPGIFTLKRMNKGDDDVVNELTEIMLHFANLTHHERTQNKIQARKVAATADWSIFIEHYIEAHNRALEHLGL